MTDRVHSRDGVHSRHGTPYGRLADRGGSRCWGVIAWVPPRATDVIERPVPHTDKGPAGLDVQEFVERVAAAGWRGPPDRVPVARHLRCRRADEEKLLRVPIRIAALLAVAGLSVAACSSTSNGSGSTDGATPLASPSAHATGSGSTRVPTGIAEPSSAAAPASAARKPKPVHVSLLESDSGVYGVGMPIIAWFNRAPTDAGAFDKAVMVTVNGKPAGGAWYWEKSGHVGAAVEAHYRPKHYWPVHARIRMTAMPRSLS